MNSFISCVAHGAQLFKQFDVFGFLVTTSVSNLASVILTRGPLTTIFRVLLYVFCSSDT